MPAPAPDDPVPPISLAGLKKELDGLTAAVKTGFFALLIVASWFNIRLTLLSPRFDLIYRDMLGATAVPPDVAFISRARIFLMALACAIPAVGITALFIKKPRPAVTTLSILLTAAIVQTYLTWATLMKPLAQILKAISSQGP